MHPTDDSALLRQFVESGSDEAFAALVNRHINLVYSVALRQTGNPHQAEEVTQAVFIILARKAAQFRAATALSSWLFQTTRLTANNFLRSNIRRQRREQEAFMQTLVNESADEVWPKLAPLLDSAVESLREKDRRAILLRFYEGKSLREVGTELESSEDAAEKTVSRALEKLRKYFSRRGVDSTAAIIAGAISANSVKAAPSALAKSVATMAVTKAAASVSTLTLVKGVLKAMAWTKAQTGVVAGIGLVLIGTGAYETSQAARLNQQNQALQQGQTALAEQVKQLRAERDDATNRLASLSGESALHENEKSELLRLRSEVAQMRALQTASAQPKSTPTARPNEGNGTTTTDSNKALLDYLGDPVSPPTNMNYAYTKEGLMGAVQLAAQNAGVTLKNIQIDDSEFPFVVGVLGSTNGDFAKLEQQIKNISGYEWGGATSSDTSGAFNMTPYSIYPPGTLDQIYRRVNVREGILYNTLTGGNR